MERHEILLKQRDYRFGKEGVTRAFQLASVGVPMLVTGLTLTYLALAGSPQDSIQQMPVAKQLRMGLLHSTLVYMGGLAALKAAFSGSVSYRMMKDAGNWLKQQKLEI
jgi:hypothetical protein